MGPEEHRVLLADFASETHMRFDHELDVVLAQPSRERLEIVRGEQYPEVGNRYVVTVDGVRPCHGLAGARYFMDHQLMVEQVEVNPVGIRASFG